MALTMIKHDMRINLKLTCLIWFKKTDNVLFILLNLWLKFLKAKSKCTETT